MCATNSFLRSLGVEIYASGHRRWLDAAKAEAVSDTLELSAGLDAVKNVREIGLWIEAV